ncbi:MAG: tetratricopeptide repeat protein [Terriglobia bacterium]
MHGDRLCEKCGQLVPRGVEECPICANSLGFKLRRETIVLLICLLVALLFVVTAITVKQFHAQERELGERWYRSGAAMLAHGNPVAALTDFRAALAHAGGNPLYELRLAQALVDSGHEVEARTYLERLWSANPADGPVNLELALWAERTGNVPEVISYYHNAIDGSWPSGSHAGRRDLRRDLCEYLLDHGQRTAALEELTALRSETPDNPGQMTEVASLFLRSGDYNSAQKEFLRSLRLNRHQPAAWAGAGKAAFLTGDYRAARRYLSDAVAGNPHDQDSAEMLKEADDVLRIDPFDRRVPATVRRRRAILAFDTAVARLASCAQSRGENVTAPAPASQSGLPQLYSQAMNTKPEMTERSLRNDPDLLDSGMQLVFQIERQTNRACGPPLGLDQALLLIAQRNGGAD